MRASILKYVLFSIIICSFEYSQNRLYFVNERNIYLEKNITKFGNNRGLADVDNQFDLNNFYESTLSLANQLNDCNNDKEMACLRNMIDSHVQNHRESNTLPNLNNVDEETKKVIHELQKELEKVKKELDKKEDKELVTQTIQNKKIIKNDENVSESKHEYFKKSKIKGKMLKGIHNLLSSSDNNELNINSEIKKIRKKIFVKIMLLFGFSLAFIITGGLLVPIIILISLTAYDIFKKMKKLSKLDI
ncbi:fam-b protein [Plasmodium vinckei vinckei]|uniref:Fam-b protein n=1 Tax=Plasmodium vinckei vinckei TaxID=54757 RepID=A0A449BUX1_PLAVN|nr:fam-b protein [Plasmodium vinckei vinckei]VEV57129.1 fam-b protein [Plasmodium vinckei vinckei]